MRKALALLMVFLPMGLKRRLGRLAFGWDIHPTAHIGLSYVLVDRLVLGPKAGIGDFNVITGLAELRLAEGASIASRNRITADQATAAAGAGTTGRRGALVLHEYAGITVAHALDCTDRVEMGEYSALAGFRSQILTRATGPTTEPGGSAPIVIGQRSIVMSGTIMLPGAEVPERSIVSAGSVVNPGLTDSLTFYRGDPAEEVRKLPDRLGFFQRGITHGIPGFN